MTWLRTKGGRNGKERSRRAEILKRLLPHINTGNYDEEGRYIVFGASSVWDMIMDLTGRPGDSRGPFPQEGQARPFAAHSCEVPQAVAPERGQARRPVRYKHGSPLVLDDFYTNHWRWIWHHGLMEKDLKKRGKPRAPTTFDPILPA